MMHCCHKKSIGLFILRLFVGTIFIVHGVQKFMNLDAMTAFFGQLGLNSYWVYIVATIETVGGVALILGLFVRYAALLLSIIMVSAIYFFKWKMGGDTWLGKFAVAEIDFALLGTNLALMFTGAGKLSLARWCKCKCHDTGEACKICRIIGCESHGHGCAHGACKDGSCKDGVCSHDLKSVEEVKSL